MSIQRINSVYQLFLDSQHNSRVANKVVQLLSDPEKNSRYVVDNRNEIVKNIAEDVGADGTPTQLMFGSKSYLHDCLQILLDEYLNYVDSIYYPDTPLPNFTDLALRHQTDIE